MIPHGLLQKDWQNQYSLLDNYAVHRPESIMVNYDLVFKSNTTQVLNEFRCDCIHSCEESHMGSTCYVIYSKSYKTKGVLQICQDELLNFDVNKSLPLALTYTNSSKQLIVDETKRTRNESIWKFTKVQPIFTLATLQIHPFQMTIKNVNNTKIVAQINRQRPEYPFDAYAYELMVMDHMLHNPYEFGLLLAVSLVVDDLRTYPETADEQY